MGVVKRRQELLQGREHFGGRAAARRMRKHALAVLQPNAEALSVALPYVRPTRRAFFLPAFTARIRPDGPVTEPN